MKKLLLAAACAVATLPAGAQFKNGEEAARYRVGAMAVMSWNLANLNAMVNGKIPFNATEAQSSAEVIALLSRLPPGTFPPGGDKLPDSRARPEIWSEPDRFKAASDRMQADASKLQSAARTGELEQLKTAFQTAAQSCKGCHDHFRKE